MGMVRSTIRLVVGVFAALLVLAAVPTASGAAEPQAYELPAATHSSQPAVAADGTAWFVPSRGTRWTGGSHSVLGSVAPDGTVSERRVAGFTSIGQVATGPDGELWAGGLL